MAKIKKNITTQDIRRLVLNRHKIGSERSAKGVNNSQEWAVFFELRNGTGYGRQTRYLDGFAIHLWPSKKFWRVAYEFKISRSDFLAELSKPEKRDWGYSISNEFYFVAPPGVAKKDEIPEGCGLLEVNGSRLKRVVIAKQRDAADLSMGEVAAIARQAVGSLDYAAVKWRYGGCDLDEDALDALVGERMDRKVKEELRTQVESTVEKRLEYLRSAMANTKKSMEDAGLPLLPWQEAVDSMLTGQYNNNLPGSYQRGINEWIKEHVHPGPKGKDLTLALKEHDRLKHNLAAMKLRNKNLFESMECEVDEATRAIKNAIEICESNKKEVTLIGSKVI